MVKNTNSCDIKAFLQIERPSLLCRLCPMFIERPHCYRCEVVRGTRVLGIIVGTEEECKEKAELIFGVPPNNIYYK